jgi:hypothetical protein
MELFNFLRPGRKEDDFKLRTMVDQWSMVCSKREKKKKEKVDRKVFLITTMPL